MDVAGTNFESWYRGQHPRLVASLASIFADDDLAREAADEAIVRAYERWEQVAVMASPEGWTYRVALNVARRRLRRQRLERTLLQRRRVDEIPPPAGEMWQLVASLSDRQRLATVLRHVAHLPEAEIAEVMGISRGGVSSTLRAAYRNLRIATDADPAHADPAHADTAHTDTTQEVGS